MNDNNMIQDSGLQSLVNEAFWQTFEAADMDDIMALSLRKRDWLVMAVMWAANAGRANWYRDRQELEKLDNVYESNLLRLFNPCMGTCATVEDEGRLSSNLLHSLDCKHERDQTEPVFMQMLRRTFWKGSKN